MGLAVKWMHGPLSRVDVACLERRFSRDGTRQGAAHYSNRYDRVDLRRSPQDGYVLSAGVAAGGGYQQKLRSSRRDYGDGRQARRWRGGDRFWTRDRGALPSDGKQGVRSDRERLE